MVTSKNERSIPRLGDRNSSKSLSFVQGAHARVCFGGPERIFSEVRRGREAAAEIANLRLQTQAPLTKQDVCALPT